MRFARMRGEPANKSRNSLSVFRAVRVLREREVPAILEEVLRVGSLAFFARQL